MQYEHAHLSIDRLRRPELLKEFPEYFTYRIEMKTYSRIKVGRLNFGKFMVIRQIRQIFLAPKFPSVRYLVVMCETLHVSQCIVHIQEEFITFKQPWK